MAKMVRKHLFTRPIEYAQYFNAYHFLLLVNTSTNGAVNSIHCSLTSLHVDDAHLCPPSVQSSNS